MAGLAITLLGGFHLVAGARDVRLGPQLARLLAFLAIHEWPSRYVIAGLLWPERSDEAALAALRTTVWRLQRQAPGALLADPRTLRLAPAVRVDLREYVDWAHRVLRAPDRLTDAELVIPAVGTELLPGWYDDWLEPERQRLHQLRVHALETVAVEQLTRARPGLAMVAALAALRSDPLRESTHRLLVRIHLTEGNVDAALHQFDSCRRLLQTEVGVRPSPELVELVAPFLHPGRP